MSPLSMRERLAAMAAAIEALEAERLQARRAANDCSGDERQAMAAEVRAGALKDRLTVDYRDFFVLAVAHLGLTCSTHGASPIDTCPDCNAAATTRAAGGVTA